MTVFPIRLVAVLVTLALSACAGSAASSRPETGAAARAASGVWAQDASDLKADPALRFGVLPNGMRYVLMKNATPTGQASLRLHFATGSLMESDDQRGLAHFIEHLAFNGSTNVPEGEMIRMLERHGLQFGPDTNAFTSFDQTVYMLDVPSATPQAMQTALFLLRETAGELLLAPEAIDRERGVVLSEERTRDTPGLRVARAQFDFLLPGQLAPKRFPIGDTEVLRTAKQPRFIDYYRAYYRPERATLVMVGDVDLDAMEADVRARFSSWTGVGVAGEGPDLGVVSERQPQTRLVVEPGAGSSVQLYWTRPYVESRDTVAERSRETVRNLAFAVLNRRLERISRESDAPFISAGASSGDFVRSAELTSVVATARPGRHAEALAAIEQEQRRLVQFGIAQAELDREVAEYRAGLTAAVAGAATRRTPALASGIASAVNEDEVYTHPSDDLALFEAAVRDLTAETVSAAARDAFTGSGPLVFAVSPTPLEGGEPALEAALRASRAQPVEAPTVAAAKSWTYTNFGAPGAVAERSEASDLGVTFVRFANGVRLTVKSTDFRDDQILVSVRIGGGRLAQSPSGPILSWGVNSVFTEGGLGRLTAEELDQVLAGRVYGASLSVGDEAFVMSGRTRPDDFELQLQVLAAYMTDPAWRPEPWARLQAFGPTFHDQLESTASGVFTREGSRLLRSGDTRWGVPSRAEIASGRLPDVKAAVGDALARGPVEVIIVGDVTVEEAIRRTAATFGALPSRPATFRPGEGADRVKFPQPNAEPAQLRHKGRADQGFAFMAWPTPDFPSDPQRARTLRVLEQVLRLRLIELLRESQGVTYSPSTSLEAGWEFPGYGYVSAAVEATPDKLEGFFADVSQVAAQLRTELVDADELQRAVRPRVETIQNAKKTNEYWLSQLAAAQADPRRLDAIRQATTGLESVTPEDVRRAARDWLVDNRLYRMTILPEASATD